MHDIFVYGTLCHIPLLRIVLGRPVETNTASLANHAVFWADGHSFPLIRSHPGGVANGLLIKNLSSEDCARLDYYEGPFGYHLQEVKVTLDGGDQSTAQVYFPKPGLWEHGAAWDLNEWAQKWGATIEATALDIMAIYPKPIVPQRYGPMLVRGSSRIRAALPVANELRRVPKQGDVVIRERREPYANFFSVEEYDLSFRRFDDGQSEVVTRAAFVSGDAVTVLPYDPVRDRVLIVEQFRTGPYARGDRQPWQLEAIAGRIDPTETPEAAARREAVEEAGLHLEALIPIASYYPSPGAKTEYLYSFLALTDLPDGSAILGGEAEEAEDIKGHLLSFDTLMALIASGEVANAPLILTALWLERERPRLRVKQST